MTGMDIMKVIRQRASDMDNLNLTHDEILSNINTAIRYLSQILIQRKAPEMIATEDVVDYTTVPAGFHSFVGQQPCYREGNVIKTYTGNDTVTMRFWQMANGNKSLSDEISFSEDYMDVLVEAALALCLNKDEYDTSFEQALLDKITALLPGGA